MEGTGALLRTMGHLEVVSTREGSWSGGFELLPEEISGLLYVEEKSTDFSVR
jgi:hypothetical protein